MNRIKQLFCSIIICFPLLLHAQNVKGIKWTEGLSWSEVLEKAKSENKYIFLDCFATWCGPCHKMDKDVYPDEKVGYAVNNNFISIKVQMDKTSYDNDAVKKWYNDANRIEKNYSVNAFPTFLFFSPDGKPLHRAVGYRGTNDFISLTVDALNQEKQYYAILANYQPGKFDTSELKGLARALKNSGGDLAARLAIEYLSRIPKKELANDDNINLMIEFRNYKSIEKFAVKYLWGVRIGDVSTKKNLELIQSFSSSAGVKQLILTNYLEFIDQKDLNEYLSLLTVFKKEPEAQKIAQKFINRLQDNRIFKRDMLFFIADFTKSNGKGFKIFYNHSDKINKIVGIKGYAQSIIENVIILEEYDSFFKKAVNENRDVVPWDSILNVVIHKYGSKIAEMLNREVKSRLYGYFAEKKGKYWQQFIKYYIEMIEKDGYDTTLPLSQMHFMDVVAINNFVFKAIFYHSNDTGQMKIGLRWMEGVLRRNPTHANNIDTYANILYKLGRKKEAIHWEEKALQIAINDKEQQYLIQSFKDNLSKMEKDIPTWAIENKK